MVCRDTHPKTSVGCFSACSVTAIPSRTRSHTGPFAPLRIVSRKGIFMLGNSDHHGQVVCHFSSPFFLVTGNGSMVVFCYLSCTRGGKMKQEENRRDPSKVANAVEGRLVAPGGASHVGHGRAWCRVAGAHMHIRYAGRPVGLVCRCRPHTGRSARSSSATRAEGKLHANSLRRHLCVLCGP